jgi:hypothetical protein
MKRAELGLLEVLGLVNAGRGGSRRTFSSFLRRTLCSISRAVVKALFLTGTCYCRRLRSGRCMAQILLSSTCKASVGERQRERERDK